MNFEKRLKLFQERFNHDLDVIFMKVVEQLGCDLQPDLVDFTIY